MKKFIHYTLLIFLCATVFAANPKPIQITAHSSSQESSTCGPENVIDGDFLTRWGSGFEDNQWLELIFDRPTIIYGLEIIWERAYAKEFSVSVSLDKKNWKTVYKTKYGHVGLNDIYFPGISTRYLRINAIKRGTEWGNSIYEVIMKLKKGQKSFTYKHWKLELEENFDTFNSDVWEKATHTFDLNMARFNSANVRLTNGTMQLWFTKQKCNDRDFAGGEYRTKKNFSYGKYVVRMKAAKGSGLISSFFTYEDPGTPWHEIDVEILGKDTKHVQFTRWIQPLQPHWNIADLSFDSSKDFHEYSFEWLPDSIQWFVDGSPRFTATDIIPQKPQKIMMNLWAAHWIEWAGKLDMNALPAVAEYDYVKYYKPVTPAKQLAKNKIRVVNDGKRYWFEMNGKKFISRGVNCVLPSDGSKGKKYDILAKYGNDKKKWAASAWKRLKKFGVTTVSGWSDDAVYSIGVPHTRVAWLGGGGKDSLIDVFEVEYANNLFEDARNTIQPRAGEPGLIGWFANNEMPWYGEYGWPNDNSKTLFDRYLALPDTAPGKQRLINFLKNTYSNSIDSFSADWYEPVKKFEDLLPPIRLTPKSLRAKKIKNDWTGVVAERYFALARAAIRKYDPNSLFLGVRFAGNAPRAVIEVCGRYVDVLSLNYYRKDGVISTKFLDNFYALTKKPILITEFSFRAMENASGDANSKGADVTVQTQADRAEGYRKYCTAMAKLPYIIGWDWFQYFDQPPGGRFDGENSNYGIISIDDVVYPELSAAMLDVNSKADELHRLSTHPIPQSFDKESWGELRLVSVRKNKSGKKFQPCEWAVFTKEKCKVNQWGDRESGYSDKITFSSGNMKIDFDTGTGWGGGMDIQPNISPLKSDGSADILGAESIVITAALSKDLSVSLLLNESGAAEVGEQYYGGQDGADGESYGSFQMRGTGTSQKYVFPLKTFQLRNSYGNQRGNNIIDLQSVKQLSLFFPGGQRKGRMEIESIKIIP